MATGIQLDEYDKLEKKHEKNVKAVKASMKRALPRACAQLAVAIAGEGNVIADITMRDGFDPDDPAGVLTGTERRRLAEAMLVIDALSDYINGTLRLKNARGPQVRGGGVTEGSV